MHSCSLHKNASRLRVKASNFNETKKGVKKIRKTREKKRSASAACVRRAIDSTSGTPRGWRKGRQKPCACRLSASCRNQNQGLRKPFPPQTRCEPSICLALWLPECRHTQVPQRQLAADVRGATFHKSTGNNLIQPKLHPLESENCVTFFGTEP